MSRKLNREEYLLKCSKKQKVEWDYSRLDYQGMDYDVEIGCPIHGWFTQNAYSHSIGLGCKKCADDANSKRILLSKEEYLERVNKKYNFFFNYDKFEYGGMDSKSIVGCPNHGYFTILASNHLRRGCGKCNNETKLEKIRLKNKDKFFKEVKKIHPIGYTYPRFVYVNASTPSIITCDKHGDFKQIPNSHLRGHGCSKCGVGNISKPEIEVQEFIKYLGYNIQTNSRKLIKPYELDIYIPSLNKAIEFNGDWWHYNPKNPESRGEKYHQMKTEMCKKIGIKLLHIRESDWKNNNTKSRKEIKKFLK